MAVQRINQVVESRIGQRDLQILVESSQGDGLIGVPRIRRQLRPELLQRTKAPRLPVRGEFHGDEVQDTGPGDLVYQGVTLAYRQGCAGVIDFAGADIEQRLGMAHRDFGLVIVLTIRADRLEDQQVPVMLEADPGRAIPLLREEALDVVANLGQAQIGPPIVRSPRTSLLCNMTDKFHDSVALESRDYLPIR